jgi:hypothetical protein
MPEYFNDILKLFARLGSTLKYMDCYYIRPLLVGYLGVSGDAALPV